METNKRKAADEEPDAVRPAEERQLTSPVREPEAKRRKQTNNDDPQPAQEATTKPTPKSERPHNVRSAPSSGPGQTGVTTGTAPRKWTEEYFRNLYIKDPSFKYLGLKDPDFAPLYVPLNLVAVMITSLILI